MNESASTWSTPRELVAVVVAPRHLKRTASVMVIVGSAFFAMNQLGVILAGHATAGIWLKAVLTYLTPLLVSNFGLLSATRRAADRSSPRPLDDSEENHLDTARISHQQNGTRTWTTQE
jgi:hypothetical protein